MKFGVSIALLAPLAAALWPIPSHFTNGSDVLWLNEDVKVTYREPSKVTTYSLKTASKPKESVADLTSRAIVETALVDAYATIFNGGFVPWRFHPRFSNFEPSEAKKTFIESVELIQNKANDPKIVKPTYGQFAENYTLEVTKDGKATITSDSALGLSHGITTFTQLFFKHTKGGVYTHYAPVSIKDEPSFEHRGLNLDVSRNFFPVKDILRTIDALAYAKFNRLHLHITDAQSWPLEVPALPELSAKGAYGPDQIYKTADIQAIYLYGALRGVEILMEIDQPGHTSSIAYSHPELIAAFNIQPDWGNYCAEPPCGTLQLNNPKVYDLLEKLYKDLLPRLSPLTSYFHTGGDEIKYAAYKLDPTVKSADPQVLQPLLQKYIDFVHNHVRAAGLIPMVWEEIVLDYNLTVGPDVIVQAWQSASSAAELVSGGHKALVGDYTYWYLDCGHGAWLDYAPGHAASSGSPFLDYCSPLKNWRYIYSYNPLTGVPADRAHLIVGGEVHLWAEQTDPSNLDRNLWPRAAAAAEVLWSGPKDAQGHNRSQIEASPRLADFRERLLGKGVDAEPVQMPFCQQELEQCVFR